MVYPALLQSFGPAALDAMMRDLSGSTGQNAE